MPAGARDIVAEWINEDPQARAQVRDLYASHSTLRTRVTTGKEQEGVNIATILNGKNRLQRHLLIAF